MPGSCRKLDGVSEVRLIVYSDFLCPWCWNAATRLASVQQSIGPAVAIDWKSYLLRPRPEPARDLEKFRAYTQGWLRVAADEPRAPFVPWASDAGPPSHSVPAHVIAKTAGALGADAGARMRDRLFRAYFTESRDISDRATLAALWREAGLDADAFAASEDPEIMRQVFADHEDRKSTRLNSSHLGISYAVFCLKKKKNVIPYYQHK